MRPEHKQINSGAASMAWRPHTSACSGPACSGSVTSMSYWNGDFSNIMAEAPRTWKLKASRPHDYCGRTLKEAALPGTVSCQAAAVLKLCYVAGGLMADAWAVRLERVEFESTSQRLVSGGLIRGDRIQGYLAKPDGAGPFPAVVGLHGCARMHEATKQSLADELVTRG